MKKVASSLPAQLADSPTWGYKSQGLLSVEGVPEGSLCLLGSLPLSPHAQQQSWLGRGPSSDPAVPTTKHASQGSGGYTWGQGGEDEPGKQKLNRAREI